MKNSKLVTRRVGFKQLACKYCGAVCERVDFAADAITCSRCVHRLVNGEVLYLPEQHKKLKKSKK